MLCHACMEMPVLSLYNLYFNLLVALESPKN
jgi:hypothetical protein